MYLEFEQPVVFQGAVVPKGSRLAGLAALVHRLKLQAPVRGPRCVTEGHVRGSQWREGSWMLYDKRYWLGDRSHQFRAWLRTHRPAGLKARLRCNRPHRDREVCSRYTDWCDGAPRLSRRHRVRDNLLGDGGYGPVIRCTEKLGKFQKMNLHEIAAETVGWTGAHLISRLKFSDASGQPGKF